MSFLIKEKLKLDLLRWRQVADKHHTSNLAHPQQNKEDKLWQRENHEDAKKKTEFIEKILMTHNTKPKPIAYKKKPLFN